MSEDKIFLHRFWDYYPDARVIPPFAALLKKGEESSSRIMWFLHFLHDPTHEFIAKLPYTDRQKLLFDFCEIKPKDTSSALYKAAEEWYTKEYLSKEKKNLKFFAEKVEQAGVAVRDAQIFAPTDIEDLTRGLKAYREIAEEYRKSQEETQKEVREERTGRLFGKDDTVGAADDGSLYV